MVTLFHDQGNRQSRVDTQKNNIYQVIDVVLHLVEMIGKGEQKRYFQKLRRLERDGSEFQPCHVVGTFNTDTELCESQKHGNERHRNVQKPQLCEVLVVKARNENTDYKPDYHGPDLRFVNRVHDRSAVGKGVDKNYSQYGAQADCK